MKNSRGITLVALIITVVIMLILAGVAIGSVTGDGLFSKTRDAVGAYENASRTEAEQIQTLMNEINDYLTGGDSEEGVAPETVAIIGDFVNYSVEVDSNGNGVIDEGETYDKWRILDFDNNGHMEIVCYNGADFNMLGRDEYANAIKILNDESIPYGEGTYGYSTRHLGSDPSNPSSYETIEQSYVKYYEDYDNIKNNINYSYLEQIHYISDIEAVQSFSNSTSKLESYCWLAARYVEAYSTYTRFRIRVITTSGLLLESSYGELYSADANGMCASTSPTRNLAPVVSLESGVKISTSLAGDGSMENPWKLTK